MSLNFRHIKPLFPALNGRKQIAQGAFTRCYEADSPDKILVLSCCPAKLAYTEVLQENTLVPRSVILDSNHLGHDTFYLYEMTRYKQFKFSELEKKDQQLYKSLRSIFSLYNITRSDLLSLVAETDDRLDEIVSDLYNYIYDLKFEISPRNLGIDPETGNLVLLDCFFCLDTLFSTRSR